MPEQDQIDHGQKALPLATEELRQSFGVNFPFAAEGVIASAQDGSPFQMEVFQPGSTKKSGRDRPSTSN